MARRVAHVRIAALAAAALLGGMGAGHAGEPTTRTHLRDPARQALLPSFHAEAGPGWLGPEARRDHGWLTRVHRPRLHDGARVTDQDLLLFEHDGTVRRAVGHLRPVRQVHARTLSPAGAEAAALERHPGAQILSTEALLVPDEDGYAPVQAVSLVTSAGLPRLLWLDAGDESAVRKDVARLRPYEGTVQVYDVNEEQGPLVIRPVDDLYYELWLGSATLQVADANNLEPESLQYDEDATWHWDPEDWRFSIAMGFYHLQNGQRFLVERGGGLFEGLEIPEVAFVNIGATNQFLEPSLALRAGHALVELDSGPVHLYLFGDGDLYDQEMGNLSHDSEVWLHEQGHARIGEITPFDDVEVGEPEFDALHEGIADYGAAIYTDDPVILEWVAADFPETHRPLDEPVHEDEFDHEQDEHANGLIIGSLGWRIRQRVGPDAADAVVLGSVHYLSSSGADFRALADGMLMADEDLHDGRYAVPILESLEAHGLEPPQRGGLPEAGPAPDGPVRKDKEITLVREADGAVVGYSWEVLDAPEDSAFTSIEGEARWDDELTFTPDVCGIWTIQLRVSDSDWLLSDHETIEVATCGAGCGCRAAGPGAAGAGLLALALLAGALVGRRRAG